MRFSPVSSASRPYRLPRIAASLLLGVGAAIGVASPAQAHNYLVSSTPAESATLTELPDRFDVTTNGDLLDLGGAPGGFALQIRGPDGLYYGDGCLEVSGPTMTTAPALGEPGAYTVLWQVVSGDGHSISGEIPFDWAPAAASTTSTGYGSPPVCGETPIATPTPSPSAAATPEDDPSSIPQASDETTTPPATDAGEEALWIGGGILAAVAAALIAYLVVGRLRRT